MTWHQIRGENDHFTNELNTSWRIFRKVTHFNRGRRNRTRDKRILTASYGASWRDRGSPSGPFRTSWRPCQRWVLSVPWFCAKGQKGLKNFKKLANFKKHETKRVKKSCTSFLYGKMSASNFYAHGTHICLYRPIRKLNCRDVPHKAFD